MFSAGHEFECWSNTDKPADSREHRQHNERYPHRWRRLVRAVRSVSVATITVAPVRCDVMGDVFMHWSNVLANIVSRTIPG